MSTEQSSTTELQGAAANAERRRLAASARREVHWKRWGPYLSERQWGTVREDYSEGGAAWESFPHDHARSRAYRWGEDGLGGISDRRQLVCFALALWNGNDPILKERLFGLTNSEGNHGEDVKELYYYLDSTPTHSYMKFLYKYPQAAFPYEELVARNRTGKLESEYELLDTGVFDENRYFDVAVEYAKADAEDILVRVTVTNQGPETADLHLLPNLWYRNTWSWGHDDTRPVVRAGEMTGDAALVVAEHERYGTRNLLCEGQPELLFVENETNAERLWGGASATPYVKDGFHRRVVDGEIAAVNPGQTGTRSAAWYRLALASGESRTIKLRFTLASPAPELLGPDFDHVFDQRMAEADAFYAPLATAGETTDECRVQRQAFAGLLWTKQFYHYDVGTWINGDPDGPTPPASRKHGRNKEWMHLYNDDIVSMPDKWEYPWYAAWDLAFHMIPFAQIDPDFAKEQLLLFTREWYMHPNGQTPAYEWALGDVNPPVHAWATWRVYKIDKRVSGKADRPFLEKVFHKLLLNFTWWLNRKDPEGMNLFQGGFLGLDNIGIFDRSSPLPTGGHLEQSDGTSWMAMYCLDMLAIALELANENRVYADIASKFFEHFIHITEAMNNIGDEGIELWDEEDGFFYDALHFPDGSHQRMKIASMVGLIPLYAVQTIEPEMLEALPGFRKRMEWFLENNAFARCHIETVETERGPRCLLSLVPRDRLERILPQMLDEEKFLSRNGVRALSRCHLEDPYRMLVDGHEYSIAYEPGESSNDAFGGNSNWRGPVWFPVNFLIVESLQKFHHFYGNTLKVACPTGQGEPKNLWDVADEISRRLVRPFLPCEDGERPVHGGHAFYRDDANRDLVLFHEYFHGDNGRGVGASHQTGWTALVAKLIEQRGCRGAGG